MAGELSPYNIYNCPSDAYKIFISAPPVIIGQGTKYYHCPQYFFFSVHISFTVANCKMNKSATSQITLAYEVRFNFFGKQTHMFQKISNF